MLYYSRGFLIKLQLALILIALLVLFSPVHAGLLDFVFPSQPGIMLLPLDQNLSDLTDVIITDPMNLQIIQFDSDTNTWINVDLNTVGDVNNANFFGGIPPSGYIRTDGSSTTTAFIPFVQGLTSNADSNFFGGKTSISDLNAQIDGIDLNILFNRNIEKIIIVDADGNGDFGTVQEGLAAASVGYTVFVAPGTYTLTSAATVSAGVSLKGTGQGIATITGNFADGLLQLEKNTEVSDLNLNQQNNSGFVLETSGTFDDNTFIWVHNNQLTGGLDVIVNIQTGSKMLIENNYFGDHDFDTITGGDTDILMIIKNNVEESTPTTASAAAFINITGGATWYISDNRVKMTRLNNEGQLTFIRNDGSTVASIVVSQSNYAELDSGDNNVYFIRALVSSGEGDVASDFNSINDYATLKGANIITLAGANFVSGSFNIMGGNLTSITGSTPLFTIEQSPLRAQSIVLTLDANATRFCVPDGNCFTNGKLLPENDLNINYVTLTTTQTVSGLKTFSQQIRSTLSTGTSPFTVASTTVVSNLNVDQVDGKDETAFLLVDGTRPLTASWDSGSFTIRAATLHADITGDIAPFTVASTTKVENLNVSLLEGKATGTSGNTIPLLDGTNTWSGGQTFNELVNIFQTSDSSGRLLRLSDSVSANTGTLKILLDALASLTTAGSDQVRALSLLARLSHSSGVQTGGITGAQFVTRTQHSGTATSTAQLIGGLFSTEFNSDNDATGLAVGGQFRVVGINGKTPTTGDWIPLRVAGVDVEDADIGDIYGARIETFLVDTGSLGDVFALWIEDQTIGTINRGVVLDSDNLGITFGGGQDAKIHYDGTDMIINPRVAGSGNLQVNANILLPDTNALYLRDTDINIHSSADGILRLSADVNVVIDENLVVLGTLFGGSPLKVRGGIELLDGDLNVLDNAFVDANLTFGGAYGEMHQNDGGNIIDITTVGAFVGIGDFNVGNIRNVLQNDTNFSVQQSGYYLLNYSVSLSGINNKTFETGVLIDGVTQATGRAHRKLASNDIGNMGGTAILDLDIGENVCIAIANLTNTADPTIESASFTITYIGRI